MKHPIEQFLKKAGGRMLSQNVRFLLLLAVLVVSAWWLLYGLAVLAVQSFSLTVVGLFLVPGLVLAAVVTAVPILWYRLRDPRSVARRLEDRNPSVQLALRSGLDFLEGRLDQDDSPLKAMYLDEVAGRLNQVKVRTTYRYPWFRYAAVVFVLNLALWSIFGARLMDKYYNPAVSFGQTHLDLKEGSITIFEPDYTQVPGRTLPLKSGTFSAYPGAKVRFLVRLPEGVSSLYLATDNGEKPIPLRLNEEHSASHEFVLLKPTSLRFLLAEDDTTGRTSPFQFNVKTDDAPEVLLRGYTPEGPINVMDPLIIEVEVKDDFGTQQLEAVVSWEGGEKRLPVTVPPARRNHFLTKQQWYLSDFEMGDVDHFSVYFEAKDNNPIDGPGVGRSAELVYELESADKKYDEFMELAKELLDTMAHVLGDNLETELGETLEPDVLGEAEAMGKQISNGLYRSLTLTNNLISQIRETPNLSRLDQTFLQKFRGGVSQQARARSEIGLFYGNIRHRGLQYKYRDLLRAHNSEELKVEGLTYELLLQLKMWAIFELERQNNELQNDLDNLEELLEQAENMEEQELMEMFNKLMDEIMKDFQKMMASAAEEMDMDMSEFMNSEALQDSTEEMQDLREQIMEALKEGDMEKAKALMQELKAQMEAAYQGMQESMGETSPEMQAMMQNMRELQGLLRELKQGEEGLERETRDLKGELDKEMGGTQAQLDEKTREEHAQATAKIHKMLEDLYNNLVEYKTEDLSEEIVRQIAQQKEQMANPTISPKDRDRLRQGIADQERLLDYLSRDGLDKLQDITLKNLEQTEKMQEYLDQGELTLSLESGMKLDSSLVNGVRISERSASPQVREEAQPRETFREARSELHKIIDALQRMKQGMEESRAQFMKEQGEQRQQRLAQSQSDLQKMIQEFMNRTEESFGGSQVEDKLRDINRSMRNAQNQLDNARLESGIQHEQDALQKIGEMMEQLQQSSRPNGRPNTMRFSRQTGERGDPSLEDIFIPESEKRAVRDNMKDAIRERLEKNLPDAYGKEIRKYYEKLMDQ